MAGLYKNEMHNKKSKQSKRGDATATDNKATAVGRQRMFPRVNNQASRYKLLTTVKKYTLHKSFQDFI